MKPESRNSNDSEFRLFLFETTLMLYVFFRLKKLLPKTIVLYSLLIANACTMESPEIKFSETLTTSGTTIHFLNASDGFDYLSKSRFVEKMSLLDFSIRMKRDFTDSTLMKARTAYLDFLKQEVLNWRVGEQERLEKVILPLAEDVYTRTPKLLQKDLYLIKTSGKEEFEAYYTSEKSIVFPKSTLGEVRMNKNPQNFKRILYHELFHIYTRNNYKKHPELYEIVGFQPQEYIIPPLLEKRRITNPDFFDYDYVIELETEKGDTVFATILTYHKSGSFHESQQFSDIIGFGLFPVSETDTGWEVRRYKGEFRPIPFKKFKNLHAKVGSFTNYLLGAEEILADGYGLKMTDAEYDNLKDSKPSDLRLLNQLIEVINQ